MTGERHLARLARELGAAIVGGPLSAAELGLLRSCETAVPPSKRELAELRKQIRGGTDPLGESLCAMRTPAERRATGSFFTPRPIVDAMLAWVSLQEAGEIVDCGAGSGRFALAAARLPTVESVIAVETDPLACLIMRANAAVLKIQSLRVVRADFTALSFPATSRRRAFVGNPPYVRHHGLAADQKKRCQRVAADLGIKLSGLAGLHAHFIVAAAAAMHPGDVLCFITAAEWLDVNYGSGVRALMLDGLRAEEVHLLDARTPAFEDAASTAVIVCARSGGTAERVRFKTARSVSSLVRLGLGGRLVSRSDLEGARSWGRIARNQYRDPPDDGAIPLGSLARVHRGAVSGANDFFVMTLRQAQLLSIENCVRSVLSSAEEVLAANGIVRRGERTKVILCPPELAVLKRKEREALNVYVAIGHDRGIHERYVPAHRSPWWRPQLLPPPPIVATYMARQAPVFALNPDGLHILNVIHGLYPLKPLSDDQLVELVTELNALRETYKGHGRTYLGGLEKFEPREMERLRLGIDSARKFAMLCDAPV